MDALASGSRSIAYTYTEPTIFFEYAYETAQLAKGAGLANIFVTNGYMTPEMLDTEGFTLDAANVDLKAFRKETYHRYVGASLDPILENMKHMQANGIWLEVTTLVIPDLNDEPEELRAAARFIARELGPLTPWHLSRFFPAYEMTDRPPTPIRTLERARAIGLEEGLQFVYLGNVGEDTLTRCPQCGEVLLRRRGYQVLENGLRAGICPHCSVEVAGVWS